MLSFDVTVVNVGGAWNSSINKVSIPVAGTYLVQIDITTCATTGGSIAEVWLNNVVAFRVQNALQVSTIVGQVRSHAAILKFIVGDQLFVRIPATTSVCYYGGTYQATSFAGLLLAVQ